MRHFKKAVIILIMLVIVFIFSDCNEAYANKKQVMETRWEKSAANAKIPAIEDLFERGEMDQAKKMLEESLQEDPQLAPLHLLSGRINFVEGQTEQARRDFSRSVELDPTLDQGWHLLGSLAAMEKDYALALEHYNKALELKPAKPDYRVSVSQVQVELGQVNEAKETLQQGLAHRSRNIDLLLSLARLHQQLSDTEQAVQVYEQAQLMHGDDRRILESCGYAYVALQKWQKAAEKLEPLLALYQPKTEQYNVVLRSLAMCSFNAENYGQALTCYDKLSVVYRDDPEVWVGMAQSALGLDDTQRSIYCAQKALQYHPSWPKAYAVLASAFYMKGQYEQSLDAFYQITEDDEFAAFAWFMTGRCYRQLRQTIQANSAFDRAEQLDPNNELVTVFLKRTLKSL